MSLQRKYNVASQAAPTPSDGPGFLYVLHGVDTRTGTDFVKVGRSNDPMQRFGEHCSKCRSVNWTFVSSSDADFCHKAGKVFLFILDLFPHFDCQKNLRTSRWRSPTLCVMTVGVHVGLSIYIPLSFLTFPRRSQSQGTFRSPNSEFRWLSGPRQSDPSRLC